MPNPISIATRRKRNRNLVAPRTDALTATVEVVVQGEAETEIAVAEEAEAEDVGDAVDREAVAAVQAVDTVAHATNLG